MGAEQLLPTVSTTAAVDFASGLLDLPPDADELEDLAALCCFLLLLFPCVRLVFSLLLVDEEP